ncbi:hypothetical protein PFISCL1PPCAC_5374 [Pristionchus fissidentatus]|uniref:Hyaluronidase n=1 Tax=Pristionchus fissidentatus TaxID=1538716 RepID=A0AAV5V3B1_9BILA|nr:hypothetical protein PFISCL1PPCAC_5374 [Pristionchus fissidentatus]
MRFLTRPLLSSLLIVLLWRIEGAEAWTDRFTTFWNVPSQKCHGTFDVAMPLRDYNIIHNSGFEFRGDQVVLFYEYKSGLFPYFEDSNTSRPVNGGLPQNVDISSHLSQLEEDIITHIPDENFSGPAVIDVEEWRPMYHLNWGTKSIYREESVRLVREKYPSMSLKSARVIAEEEFNSAAKKVLTLSLQLARRLRPKAKWSMYGFPYCNYSAGKQGELRCSENFRTHNDKLRWLYKEFSVLSPSIYLDLKNNNSAVNYRYIYALLAETKRIADEFSPPIPIVPYTKFEYNPYDHPETHAYYTKRDLCNSLKLSSDMGAAGVLVWSTDSKMTKERCHSIRVNVAHSFGPAADLVRRRANHCALDKCSGNGRCILRRPSDVCTFRMPMEEYTCACDEGYYGESCERMHHLVDADAGAGSGSEPDAEEPGFKIAVPGFIQEHGHKEDEEEKRPLDPLGNRESALHAGVVPPVPELFPSLFANRITDQSMATVAPGVQLGTPPTPLPLPPNINVNDNREDAPGISLFTRIL